MRRARAVFIAIGIILSCNLAISAEGPANAKPSVTSEKTYASPREVFDVYRAAVAKGDKRTEYYCLTPEGRNDEVLGALMATEIILNTPKMTTVLKKYGLAPAAGGGESQELNIEYYKRYKAKYGVDLQKLVEEYQAKQQKAVEDYFKKAGIEGGKEAVPIPASVVQQIGPPPANPFDQALYQQVVLEKVADKVGFVVEMAEAIEFSPETPQVFGELKDLRVEGNTAVGRATSRIHMCGGAPGQKEKWHWSDHYREFRFRKVKDSWFVENR